MLCHRAKEGRPAAEDGLDFDGIDGFEGGETELLRPNFRLNFSGQVAVDVAVGPLNVILGRLA